MSKILTGVYFFTPHSKYVALSHYVRNLFSLMSIIKEVIEKLGIDHENLRFVSRSTFY